MVESSHQMSLLTPSSCQQPIDNKKHTHGKKNQEIAILRNTKAAAIAAKILRRTRRE